MTGPSTGFTIVEVVAALALLGVGAIAVASGAGAAERMLGQGHRRAVAAILAAGRLDQLRRSARPLCTDAAFSDGTAFTAGVREHWSVGPSGPARTVRDVIEYAGPAGAILDTMSTVIACPR